MAGDAAVAPARSKQAAEHCPWRWVRRLALPLLLLLQLLPDLVHAVVERHDRSVAAAWWQSESAACTSALPAASWAHASPAWLQTCLCVLVQVPLGLLQRLRTAPVCRGPAALGGHLLGCHAKLSHAGPRSASEAPPLPAVTLQCSTRGQREGTCRFMVSCSLVRSWVCTRSRTSPRSARLGLPQQLLQLPHPGRTGSWKVALVSATSCLGTCLLRGWPQQPRQERAPGPHPLGHLKRTDSWKWRKPEKAARSLP